jgi:hypothetical protein
MVCSPFATVPTHMIKSYYFLPGTDISEENQDDLFFVHEISNIHDELLFFPSKWAYKWRDSD